MLPHYLSLELEITDHYCGFNYVIFVSKNKKNQTVMTATKENGLYYVTSDNINIANTANDDNMTSWHRKLGHINERDLKLIDKKNRVKGVQLMNGKLPTCETCIKGKMTQLPYASVEGPQSSEPLELIHSDVCGPMRVETLVGSRYFLTFIDDFTKYCCVYFIAHKNEVLDKFKEFKNKVENFLQSKIKMLQSDNGREYCNKEFDAYLK